MHNSISAIGGRTYGIAITNVAKHIDGKRTGCAALKAGDIVASGNEKICHGTAKKA
jgi:hypothetical protein